MMRLMVPSVVRPLKRPQHFSLLYNCIAARGQQPWLNNTISIGARMKHSSSKTTKARNNRPSSQATTTSKQEMVQQPLGGSNPIISAESIQPKQISQQSSSASRGTTSKMAKLQQRIATKIANERKGTDAAAQAAVKASATTATSTTHSIVFSMGKETFRNIKSYMNNMVTPATTPKVLPELPPIYSYGYSENAVRWSQGLTLTALTAAGMASQQQRRDQTEMKSPPVSDVPDVSTLSSKVIVTNTVLDEWVSVWQRETDGCLVYLLGTTHRTPRSMQLAQQLVQDVRPQAVFVELDVSRIQSHILQLPAPLPKRIGLSATDAAHMIRSGHEKTITWLFPKTPSLIERMEQRFLIGPQPLQFQQQTLMCDTRLEKNHIPPDADNEFYYAIRAGQKCGATIVLGDQAYPVTRSRRRLAFALEVLNVLCTGKKERDVLEAKSDELVTLLETVDDISDNNAADKALEQIDGTRQQVRYALGLAKEVSPAILRAFIDERDDVLVNNLHALNQFESVVAIVGKMHMDGLEERLAKLGWKQVQLSQGDSALKTSF